MALSVVVRAVPLEIHTWNVHICKAVAVIPNAVQLKHVLMVNVDRHVNVAGMRCVTLSIIEPRVSARTDIRAMHALAVRHRQIHVIQIHAELMLSVNWTVAIRFATVRKA